MGSNSLLPHGQRKYFTSPVECRQFEEVLTVPICWEDHNADDDGDDDSTGAMTNFWLNYLPCSISLRMCGWPLLMYNLISWRFVDDCRWNIPSTASALAVVSRSSFRYVTLRSHPIPSHTIPYHTIPTHPNPCPFCHRAVRKLHGQILGSEFPIPESQSPEPGIYKSAEGIALGISGWWSYVLLPLNMSPMLPFCGFCTVCEPDIYVLRFALCMRIWAKVHVDGWVCAFWVITSISLMLIYDDDDGCIYP